MTGNGKFIPPIKMVMTRGWCVRLWHCFNHIDGTSWNIDGTLAHWWSPGCHSEDSGIECSWFSCTGDKEVSYSQLGDGKPMLQYVVMICNLFVLWWKTDHRICGGTFTRFTLANLNVSVSVCDCFKIATYIYIYIYLFIYYIYIYLYILYLYIYICIHPSIHPSIHP